MGCISSKAKRGSDRMGGGTPTLSEDMLVPRKGSSHFLALVCTATTITDRRLSESLTFQSPILAAETEVIASVVSKDQSKRDNEANLDPPKRSRSWHSFPSEEMPHADGALEENSNGAIRSTSFHTVKEYGRLLERIWYARLTEKGNTVEESIEKDMSTSPIDTMNQNQEVNADSQETLQTSQGDASSVRELNASSETVKEDFPGDSFPPSMEEPSFIGDDILGELSIKEESPPEMPLPLRVKGFKRKSIARGLDVLKIPCTFELPDIASLREWLPGGQVFSPGTNPNTEFGSYPVSTDDITNKSGEGIIFNHELVISLEEQLQHLKEAEQEAILKHITATWEVSGSTRIKEEISIS